MIVYKCLLIFLPPNLAAPSEFIMAKLPPKYPDETEEAIAKWGGFFCSNGLATVFQT